MFFISITVAIFNFFPMTDKEKSRESDATNTKYSADTSIQSPLSEQPYPARSKSPATINP